MSTTAKRPTDAARQPRAAQDPYSVSTVERALALLAVFSRRQPELGLAEIAALSGLHKATAFRLLAALCKRSMVMKDPSTGLYRLGFALVELAEIAKLSTGLVGLARPIMHQIRDQLGETVYIAARFGDGRINMEQIEGLHDIRRVVAVGVFTPLYKGTTSHALLAALPDDEINGYLDRTRLLAHAPGAVPDVQAFWRDVATIRRNGFAETLDKEAEHGASISAAIRGYGNIVLGALTVSTPLGRYSDAVRTRTIKIVTDATQSLSRQLGATGGSDPDSADRGDSGIGRAAVRRAPVRPRDRAAQ